MRTIRMVAGAEMRHRWGSIVVLTLLVGFVGTVVVASAAGARRTASSLERFEQSSRAADIEISAGNATPEQLREFRATKGVAAVGVLRQLTLVQEDVQGFLPVAGQLDDKFGTEVDRARVIRGRDARAADELTIGEALASSLGVSVGDRISFSSYTPEQVGSNLTGDVKPEGPQVTFRVVGIVRRPLDLGGRGAKGGVIVPTQAFTRKHVDDIGSFAGDILRVRTEAGAADVPGVVQSARRIFGSSDQFNALGLGIEGQAAQSAIDVTTVALWVLAAVAALAGLVAIGLALTRQMAHVEADQDALRALGLRPRERWAATAAGALPIALAGSLLTVVGAVLASPIFPVGVARQADPALGLHFDGLALVGGFLGVAIIVTVLGGLAAVSAIRRRAEESTRPGLATNALTRAGVAPVVTTGVSFALERGRERSGVPVRTALAGAVIGVLGAIAALTFAASLDELVTTPRQYGWSFDYIVADAQADDFIGCGGYEARLTRDPAIAAVGQLCTQAVEVAGHPINVISWKSARGAIGPTIVEGRAPRADDEVALGADTLRASAKHIGQKVSITSEAGKVRYRIVGQTLSVSLADPAPLADGAAVTAAGMARLGSVDDAVLVVRVAPGVDREDAVRHLRRVGGGYEPVAPSVPSEVERIRQIDAIPVVLAAFVAAVALIAVGYALVIGIRRRRRDLAILKTLGFNRRQVRAVVAWQATTLAAVGVIVGIPLGIVVGRVAWRLVTDSLGVAPTPTLPVVALFVVAIAAVLLANLIAWFPARRAARTRPATVLRSE